MSQLNTEKQSVSIIKNLNHQQLGMTFDVSMFSYSTTLKNIQRLKATTKLKPRDQAKALLLSKFNRQGNLLATTYHWKRLIHIWDWSKAEIKNTVLAVYTSKIAQVDWVPENENLIVTSGEFGNISLSNVTRKTNTLVLESQSTDKLYKFCIMKDSPFVILAAGDGGKIINIDLRMKNHKNVLSLNDINCKCKVKGIDINPTDWKEFCISNSNELNIFDQRCLSGPVKKLIYPKQFLYPYNHSVDNIKFDRHVSSVKYNYNGKEILVNLPDEAIHLYDKILNTVKIYTAHREYFNMQDPANESHAHITATHFVGDRNEFIAASVIWNGDNKLCWWDNHSRQIVHINDLEEMCLQFDVHLHSFAPTLALNMIQKGVAIWQ